MGAARDAIVWITWVSFSALAVVGGLFGAMISLGVVHLDFQAVVTALRKAAKALGLFLGLF